MGIFSSKHLRIMDKVKKWATKWAKSLRTLVREYKG